MYPLELSINPQDWRIFNGRKADPAFTPIRDKVFVRDNYTCQYCGFQAKEHQEVVNLDHNYRNNRFSNMITSCVLCTQCQFLDVVGSVYGGGKLVYLPEMSQAELNSFCHVVFCAMMNKTGYLESAQSAYRSFRFRTKPVEEKFGVDTSTPNVFCQLLLNSDELDKNAKRDIFKDLRLLPTYARFKKQLEDWAAAAAEELAQEA